MNAAKRTTSPDERLAIARARCMESVAGILAMLHVVLLVVITSAAIWLISRFVF